MPRPRSDMLGCGLGAYSTRQELRGACANAQLWSASPRYDAPRRDSVAPVMLPRRNLRISIRRRHWSMIGLAGGGARWLLRPHIRPTLGEKLGWSVCEGQRLELVLEERTEFQTHERMFNKQADVGSKMSRVKRHDQVPECGQNQSDCRGECPRMQAGPGPRNRARSGSYCVGIATMGLCLDGGRKQLCRTDKDRQDGGLLAGWLTDCGGGIWLTLTGSFSEG